MADGYFQRSLYVDGQRLTAGDLQNQQEYENGKRRLINREILGWGVVRGFAASITGDHLGILISPGFALDAEGREIWLPESKTYPLASLVQVLPDEATQEFMCVCVEAAEVPKGEGTVLSTEGIHTVSCNRVQELPYLKLKAALAETDICLAHLQVNTSLEGHLEAIGITQHSTRFQLGAVYHGQAVPGYVCGTVTMHCAEPSRASYSQEIPHGLGPGDVHVTLSLAGHQNGRACRIGGDVELFGADVQMAVELYPDDGTFVVAVRVPFGKPGHTFRINWYAVRAHSEQSIK